MKKIYLLSVFMIVHTLLSAQVQLELKYYKHISFIDGQWEPWPVDFSPSTQSLQITQHKDTFYIELNLLSKDYHLQMLWDEEETQRIRQLYNDQDYYVYQDVQHYNFIWLRHTSLEDLYKKAALWSDPQKNIQLFFLDYELNHSFIFQSYLLKNEKAPLQARAGIYQKADITTEWAGDIENIDWMTATDDAFIELKVLEKKDEYQLRYFENGKFIKSYHLTSAPNPPSYEGLKDKLYQCYQIKGMKEGYVYFVDFSITNWLANPQLWHEWDNAFLIIQESKLKTVIIK